MAAALTSVTTKGVSPSLGKKVLYVETAATAGSGDYFDITSATVTGGETLSSVDWVVAWDQTTGDVVTATDSSGTITIDASGGTTNHTYALLVVGDA
jgi:hypothetical protein